MPKKSFSIHSDYYDEILALSPEQRSELLTAFIYLSTDKELPQLDTAGAMLFRLMKAQSERISAINSTNGSKGGKANHSKKSEDGEHNEKGEAKRTKPSVPVSVTVSDTAYQENIPPTPTEGTGASGSEEDIDPITLCKFSTSVERKLREWIEYKTERKEAYKPTGLRSLLAEIGQHVSKYGDSAVVKVINASMANNWRGIVWDKTKELGGSENVNNEHGQAAEPEYDMCGFHNAIDRSGGSELDE